MIDDERRAVRLVRGADTVPGTLRFEARSKDYRMVLDGPTGAIEVSARDLFEALVEIRRLLEPDGWSVAVQGARRDTYPSGMLRDMGGARRVYVLHPGCPARREDLVDTFAEADQSLLGTVAEQRAHYDRWRATRSTAS